MYPGKLWKSTTLSGGHPDLNENFPPSLVYESDLSRGVDACIFVWADTIKRPSRVGASTSSTTVAADSPEHSSCGNTSTTPTGDGETTALLGPGYSESHSQHSLLMVFDRQDEDTLI